MGSKVLYGMNAPNCVCLPCCLDPPQVHITPLAFLRETPEEYHIVLLYVGALQSSLIVLIDLIFTRAGCRQAVTR